MISHVVLFKLAEPVAQSVTLVCDALRVLGDGRIPEVMHLRLEPGTVANDGAWDLGLFAAFADVDDFRTYLTHPEHLAAGQQAAPHIVETAMLDY
jgi:hypothetical protein